MINMPFAVIFPSHAWLELTFQMLYEFFKSIINQLQPTTICFPVFNCLIDSRTHNHTKTILWIRMVFCFLPLQQNFGIRLAVFRNATFPKVAFRTGM